MNLLHAGLCCALFTTSALGQDLSTRDYAGTYSLQGTDSSGNSVKGWLKLAEGGQVERYVRSNGKTQRFSGVLAARSNGERVVFSGPAEGAGEGLVSALANDDTGESGLSVTWSPSEVRVEYLRGGYTSHERGTRVSDKMYDLTLLRDEVPAQADVRSSIEVSVGGTPTLKETLSYARTGDAHGETRAYADLTVNGKQFAPFNQELTRSGQTLTPTKILRKLKTSKLLSSSYRAVGVTAMVPKAPIALGDAWDLPLASAVELLNLPQIPEAGTLRGQLLAVDQVEGGLRYRFELKVDVTYQGAPLQLVIRVSQSPREHSVTSRLRFVHASGEQRSTTKHAVTNTGE